jgi:hypothetical protein
MPISGIRHPDPVSPPYELRVLPCAIRRNQFRREIRSQGHPLLISHDAYKSRAEAEAEGGIELQNLNEKWQAAHRGSV